MAVRSGPYQQWVRETRMPNPPPPKGSCDCQFHIYGDPAKYPPSPATTYAPIDATFQDAVAMHRALGFERGVIVHSSVYGSDHRLLLDTLEGLEPSLRKRYRATSIIDDTVSDKELERLSAAGVCAARLNIAKMFGVTPSHSEAQRTIDRIRPLGWHVRVHVRGNDLLEFSDVLKSVRDIPMVIDHLGHVDLSKGLDQPVCRWILDILKRDNWWMMASNGNRDSKMEAGWDDAIPVGRAYIEAAPDRIIWATDWPHPMWTKRMMNDAEEVELLYRYVDNDAALLQKILVDNPVRLHGFEV
jgi:predicted TIM-barrel fold metal-dependent hydrolase